MPPLSLCIYALMILVLPRQMDASERTGTEQEKVRLTLIQKEKNTEIWFKTLSS